MESLCLVLAEVQELHRSCSVPLPRSRRIETDCVGNRLSSSSSHSTMQSLLPLCLQATGRSHPHEKLQGLKWAQSLCLPMSLNSGETLTGSSKNFHTPLYPREIPRWLCRFCESTHIQPWIEMLGFLYCQHLLCLLLISLELLSLPWKGESHCKYYFSMFLIMTDVDIPPWRPLCRV